MSKKMGGYGIYEEGVFYSDKQGREHPDTGLGLTFKYPGNARKLRDATKIRLWREYLRGMHGLRLQED